MIEKRFNFAEIEKKFKDKFVKKIYGGKSFCTIMPPPNITGNLHLGHSLIYTMQDVVTRYYNNLGYDTFYHAGVDHAGISGQIAIEKFIQKGKINLRSLTQKELISKGWEWKKSCVGNINSQIQNLGLLTDLEKSKFTMDEDVSQSVIKVFIELYRKGLIYRGKRMVNWDARMQTVLSDLEVSSREEKTSLWYLKYKIIGKNEYITVATTRPETIFADAAIAIHPQDSKWKKYFGEHVYVPIINRSIPIIEDNYCDPEKGSGAVKITPAHDFNDFAVGQRHKLENIEILNHKGLLENVPDEFIGLNVKEARKKVITLLQKNQCVVKSEEILHQVPYNAKSNTVLEPKLTIQWFLDTPKLAKPAINAVKSKEIEFIPSLWEKTYFHWMNNVTTWCISRQLWWGHKIPAWYFKDDIFVSENKKEAMQMAYAKYGKNVDLIEENDVLDTWFSSALWPFICCGWPNNLQTHHYPTYMIVTGFDIIFFWIARMIMMSISLTRMIPFKKVVISPLIVDKNGEKMSKSKGNVINPAVMMEKYGADALRLALIKTPSHSTHIMFDEQNVISARNFITKLWNAARYTLMKTEKLHGEKIIQIDKIKDPMNCWIVSLLHKIEKEVGQLIENMDMKKSAQVIHDFTWYKFCDWYIEFSKELILNNFQESSTVLLYVMQKIVLNLNPFIPFVTSELKTFFDFDIHIGYPVTQEQNSDVEGLLHDIENIRQKEYEKNLSIENSNLLFIKYEQTIKRILRLDNLTVIK